MHDVKVAPDSPSSSKILGGPLREPEYKQEDLRIVQASLCPSICAVVQSPHQLSTGFDDDLCTLRQRQYLEKRLLSAAVGFHIDVP